MFDIGFWELTIIAVIGLIVLGPERLPVVARTLGSFVGRAKGYVRGLTSELAREVDVDDIRSEVRSARQKIESDTHSTMSSLREPLAPETPKSGVKKEDSFETSAETGKPAPANPVAHATGHYDQQPSDGDDRNA